MSRVLHGWPFEGPSGRCSDLDSLRGGHAEDLRRKVGRQLCPRVSFRERTEEGLESPEVRLFTAKAHQERRKEKELSLAVKVKETSGEAALKSETGFQDCQSLVKILHLADTFMRNAV